MDERRVDVALAGALAVLPLLPTGLEHAGLPAGSWSEVILLVLAIVRMMTPDRRPPDDARRLPRRLAPSLAIYLAAMSGAALVGLAAENAIGSSVFAAHLAAFPGRALDGFDQLADPLYPLRVWLTLIEGPLAFLLTFDICRRATDPRRRTRVAAVGAVTGLALVSGFAIVQYFTRFNLHPYWVAANPDLTRSHATFEDPNALGAYLLLGISLAAALTLKNWKTLAGWKAWALAGTIVLACIALMTTVSRAAWAAAVIAGVVIAAYAPRPARRGERLPAYRRLARAATVTGFLLVLVWAVARAVLPSQPAPRPSSPMQAMLVSLDPRVPLAQVLKKRHVYWKAATQMAADHPLAGVGLGRYPRLAAEFGASDVAPENAHNFPLQLIAETGVPGLLAFALLAAAVVGSLVPASAQPAGDADSTWILHVGLLALGLTLLSGHAVLLPSIQLVLGTWLAVGMPYAGLPRRIEPSRAGIRRWTAVGVMILLAIYLTIARAERWRGSSDPWGYTFGLHADERDAAGVPFRWTGSEARLHLVPPPGSTTLVLACSVLSDVDGGVRSAAFEAAGHHVKADCENGRWTEVALPLEPARAAAGMDIRITVAGAFVPASRGLSGDQRLLGATLQPPRFTQAPQSRADQ